MKKDKTDWKTAIYLINKLLDIAEECYPKYYRSDLIAEANDFLKDYENISD